MVRALIPHGASALNLFDLLNGLRLTSTSQCFSLVHIFLFLFAFGSNLHLLVLSLFVNFLIVIKSLSLLDFSFSKTLVIHITLLQNLCKLLGALVNNVRHLLAHEHLDFVGPCRLLLTSQLDLNLIIILVKLK